MDERRKYPFRGYVGCVLIATGWFMAWVRPDGFEFLWENSFFPLWLGYNLAVDAINWKRTGTSLFARNKTAYAGLFILSIPGWWLFEFMNLYVQNWHYILNRPVGDVEYAIRFSIAFSVVIPAVFATAELWGSSPVIDRSSRWRRIAVTPKRLAAYLLTGIAMLVAVISFPRYCFPLLWGCLFLIFDALNAFLGAFSIISFLDRRNWRPALSLGIGALTCGFFWEMWNFCALPKWTYTIPFVNVWHFFEMPLAGYIGYLPFGLETFALYILLIELFGFKQTPLYGGEGYVRL